MNILSDLNPAQKEAVVYDKGPLLILAGAGSGKTKALTHRAAYLIKERSVNPNNLLLVTFTNKAADEMRNRVKQLVDIAPNFMGTFHSFCARILRIEAEKAGFEKNFVIYDEADQIDAIKKTLKEIGLSDQRYKPSIILSLISQAKNELIGPLEYAQYVNGDFQIAAARVYLIYQKTLKEYQALDFDDLIFETVKLFQKEPEVLAKYQNRFEHILVDEYQDTNKAQYELTKILGRKRRNLCVVGDASQAIYSWRGANYRNLMSLKEDFPEIKVINLEQNYRSTKTILDAANQIIRRNTTHPILKLWTENSRGTPITVYRGDSEIDEATYVANEIANDLLTKGSIYSDFAVLYRTNAQSRIFEEVFIRAGLPYVLIGGVKFYERKEIKDCLAFVRFIANNKDNVSKSRIEKIGKRKLEKILVILGNEMTDSLKDKPTIEILDLVLSETKYLEQYNPKDEEDAGRLENIKELRSVAAEYPDVNQFLETVSLIQSEYFSDKKSQGDKPDAITLSTIHAAKGREFNTVFLVGMEEGIFPHSRSATDREQLEEERRLCYVGMTRAKHKLYLTHTRKRLYFGKVSANPPSRFLHDIPKDLSISLNSAGFFDPPSGGLA